MVNRYSAGLDRVFQALADPTRRRILICVASSDCTVSDLKKPFRISAPAISRHLKVLERASLIRRTKSGKYHRFRINDRPIHEVQTLLQQLLTFWNRRLDNLEEFLKKEITETN